MSLRIPILFADVRDCSALIAWSALTGVAVGARGTAYSIGRLYRLRGRKPQELEKLSDGSRIAAGYVRPYVPCRTPEFLLAAAENPQPWSPPRTALREIREGERRLREHVIRERDRRIVDEAKRRALREQGRLTCEVCSFDFARAYGDLGADFIEAHHRRPLSDYRPRGEHTHVEDLALVCANCHRMLHLGSPVLTIKELIRLRSKAASK